MPRQFSSEPGLPIEASAATIHDAHEQRTAMQDLCDSSRLASGAGRDQADASGRVKKTCVAASLA